MKKVSFHLLLLIFAAAMVIQGLRGNCLAGVGEAFRAGSFSAFVEAVDQATSKQLNDFSAMMDLNAARENLMGTRILRKEEDTVIRADSGTLLMNPREQLNEEQLTWLASQVGKIRNAAEENGAAFLFCPVPEKGYGETVPPNAEIHSEENFLNLLRTAEGMGIPSLNLVEALAEEGIPTEDIYFRTDHHWKPQTGFAVAKAICRELSKRYGQDFSGEYSSLNSFEIIRYEDWFLGSAGKKTGLWFTWEGADDFDLMIPTFPTSFTEEMPTLGESRTGDFQNTLLHMEYMLKDYYGANPYITYSGGDFRLQVLRNHLMPGWIRILVVRDSYGCVVTPFLALQAEETHIIDDRGGPYPAPEQIDIPAYIAENRPDYVIVLKNP